MSYDLAVWEGEPPRNALAAGEGFQRLYNQYIDTDASIEPTPRIAAYVTALLDRYPDIGTAGGDDSPWSIAPLMNEAAGRLSTSRWCGACAKKSRRGRHRSLMKTDLFATTLN